MGVVMSCKECLRVLINKLLVYKAHEYTEQIEKFFIPEFFYELFLSFNQYPETEK